MKKSRNILILTLVISLLGLLAIWYKKGANQPAVAIGSAQLQQKKTQTDQLKINKSSNKPPQHYQSQKDSASLKGTISELHLQFIDNATGFSVTPERVEIKRRGDQSNETVIKNYMVKGGGLSKQLPDGIYDIAVFATGYNAMQTFFELRNQSINASFNLVSIHPPKELSISYIESLHRNDAMVIVGTLIDDNTGNPLGGVEISSEDKVANSLSNKNGFFQFVLPLANNEEQLKKRGIISFKKKNYITEIRENFDMWPNGDAIVRIKMKKGVGLNKAKIVENRKSNQVIL